MTFDPVTFLTAIALAVAVTACVFGTTTLQRHDDRPNRLATAALVAAFVALGSGPAVESAALADAFLSEDTTGRGIITLMALGVVGATGLLWASTQAFAQREAHLIVVAGAAALAALATAVTATSSFDEAIIPAAVLAALCLGCAALELRRSTLRSNLNSLILETTSLMCAGAGLVVAGLTSFGQITPLAGWSALACLVGMTMIIAGLTLMALRVERYGNWWTLGEDEDRNEFGIEEAESFMNQARDRIERSSNVGQPVHVIATSLPGLNDLNLAYGHLAGDAALRWVAELLRRQAPVSAVLGHLGGGRFAIVTSREPELVANAIQNGMMRVPPPATLPVRLTPVFAWTSSDEVGYNLDLLRQTAEERLSHVA